MEMVLDKIDNAINLINENTDLFYQNKVNEGYALLNNTLLELSITIQYIYDSVNSTLIEENLNTLNNNLKEAMLALENKDAILLSDILAYEIKHELEIIKHEI